ncbi:MAG: hypothetical protein ACOC3J_03605 [Gemmatimonadota bacterium]
MIHDPFPDEPRRRVNPFGEDDTKEADPGDAAATLEHSAARIRRLKQQVGAEGLSLSATRELIDHISAALDAAASALRHLAEPPDDD